MSNQKEILILTGATGSQGGSILKAIFASTEASRRFHVRALTRNPHSEAAKKLKLKYPEIELVQGNSNDKSSLEKVFSGASYAFLVTSFWDPAQRLDPNTDYIQGRLLVDVSIEQKLKFIVWSSLHDVATISNNRLNVPHFTSKNKVEQYIKSTELAAAFVYAGFYANNWVKFPLFGPVRGPDGVPRLALPLRADVALPVVDIDEDFGQFVVPLFLQPERYKNAKVLAASEYLTNTQLAKAYEEVQGEKVKVVRTALEEIPLEELRETVKYWNEFGYYNGEYLSDTFSQYDDGVLKLHSFKDWLIREKYTVPHHHHVNK